jgi:hypothetical protein
MTKPLGRRAIGAASSAPSSFSDSTALKDVKREKVGVSDANTRQQSQKVHTDIQIGYCNVEKSKLVVKHKHNNDTPL